VDGLKTGHTEAAGYCLVATAKRDFPNVRQGRRLLSVVLGAASENARANESQKLLNWGYTAFEAVKLFDAGQAVATPQGLEGQDRPRWRWAGPSPSSWRCPPAARPRSRPRCSGPTPGGAVPKGQAVAR
jgi:D-alanyl-D-alanine carboxypeptidase (penicillin-binding protein 5/6)